VSATPSGREVPVAARPTALRILLVEDDGVDRLEIRRMLQRGSPQAYEICEATGMEEALRALEDGAWDCVLLDYRLPDGDGLELLQALGAEDGRPFPPIVLMTAYGDDRVAIDAVRRGAQDYLVKGGFDAQGLDRAIRHATERHRMLEALHEASRRSEYLATHCPVTDLPNRFLLQDRLVNAIARRSSSHVAVLFLDLDRFKRINDTLGHWGGDRVLREVGQRVLASVRRSDTVARMGGDEFCVVLTDLDGEVDAARMARRIAASVARDVAVERCEVLPTASIGIALSPRDGTEPERLLRCADLAMYRAKQSGGNRCEFYSDALQVAARDRIGLENDLRKALGRDELSLHFQPQVHGGTRAVVGVEALLRWRHPRRGWVPPAEFIPVAEDLGLIGELGEWVLRRACAHWGAWRRAGLPGLPVSVNLSPRQLWRPGFATEVAALLAESALPGGALALEVTEGCLIRDFESARRVLSDLKALGLRVFVDDFGTGYSSLGVLKRLPIDALKVDRSFVSGLGSDPQDEEITRAIVALAQALGMGVVAEGVEEEAQRDFLLEIGCSAMQGFLFAPPLPAEDLARVLARGRVDAKPAERPPAG